MQFGDVILVTKATATGDHVFDGGDGYVSPASRNGLVGQYVYGSDEVSTPIFG